MKRKTLFVGLVLAMVGFHAKAQSLPANTCGIVYTYDAAGNRTQRKYVCNNSPATTAYTSTKSLDLKTVQQVDRLFPNPTTGHFTVTFSKPLDNGQVTLMDMGGRVLQQSVKSGSQVEFDISRQPAGIYLLRIQDGINAITQKVVKQ